MQRDTTRSAADATPDATASVAATQNATASVAGAVYRMGTLAAPEPVVKPPRAYKTRPQTKKPLCATAEEYAGWLRAARAYPPGVAGFCEDCTPAHKAEMIRAGKCEHPDVMFDGDRGYFPQDKPKEGEA